MLMCDLSNAILSLSLPAKISFGALLAQFFIASEFGREYRGSFLNTYADLQTCSFEDQISISFQVSQLCNIFNVTVKRSNFSFKGNVQVFQNSDNKPKD